MGFDFRAPFRRIRPAMVAASCAGVVLAYLTGMLVTGPFHRASGSMGAMLACTSAVVVLQTPGLRESLRAGLLRVAGTAIGALLAYLYLRIFAFSTFGMMCSVALLVTLSMLLGIPDNGRMATITLLAILLVSQQNHALAPGMNCLLRFVESALGVAIGVVLAWASSRLSPPAAAAQPVQCPPAAAVPCRPAAAPEPTAASVPVPVPALAPTLESTLESTSEPTSDSTSDSAAAAANKKETGSPREAGL